MKAQVERDKMLSEVEDKMKNFDKKDEKGSVTSSSIFWQWSNIKKWWRQTESTSV